MENTIFAAEKSYYHSPPVTNGMASRHVSSFLGSDIIAAVTSHECLAYPSTEKIMVSPMQLAAHLVGQKHLIGMCVCVHMPVYMFNFFKPVT